MANWSDPRTIGAVPGVNVGTQDAAFDAGLRSYMLSVYNYMASGVLLTGIVALLFAKSGFASLLLGPTGGFSTLGLIAAFSPLAFVLVMSFGLNKLSTPAVQACFWAYAAVMGISMSTFFLRFTGESMASTK